jgi:hypothetical protein
MTIGFLFLEETHAEKRHQRDRGLEIGQWLLAKCSQAQMVEGWKTSQTCFEDGQSLFNDEAPPGYKSTESSPRLLSVKRPHPNLQERDVEQTLDKKNRGFTKAFSKQIVFIIVGYGILA